MHPCNAKENVSVPRHSRTDLALRIFLAHSSDVGMAYSPRSTKALATTVPLHMDLVSKVEMVTIAQRNLSMAVRAAVRRREYLSIQMHSAVLANDATAVSAVFADGAEPDTPNAFGWSPLHVAVQKKYFDVARVLLDLRCNVNAVNTVGVWNKRFTPLDVLGESYTTWTSLRRRAGIDELTALLRERGGAGYASIQGGEGPVVLSGGRFR